MGAEQQQLPKLAGRSGLQLAEQQPWKQTIPPVMQLLGAAVLSLHGRCALTVACS